MTILGDPVLMTATRLARMTTRRFETFPSLRPPPAPKPHWSHSDSSAEVKHELRSSKGRGSGPRVVWRGCREELEGRKLRRGVMLWGCWGMWRKVGEKLCWGDKRRNGNCVCSGGELVNVRRRFTVGKVSVEGRKILLGEFCTKVTFAGGYWLMIFSLTWKWNRQKAK